MNKLLRIGESSSRKIERPLVDVNLYPGGTWLITEISRVDKSCIIGSRGHCPSLEEAAVICAVNNYEVNSIFDPLEEQAGSEYEVVNGAIIKKVDTEELKKIICDDDFSRLYPNTMRPMFTEDDITRERLSDDVAIFSYPPLVPFQSGKGNVTNDTRYVVVGYFMQHYDFPVGAMKQRVNRMMKGFAHIDEAQVWCDVNNFKVMDSQTYLKKYKDSAFMDD